LSDDGVFCVDEHDLEWSSYDGADAAAAGMANIRYKALSYGRRDVPSMTYIEYAPGCTDPVHRHDTGEAFVVGTGAWTLSASTFIDITPAQWTPTSSVSVRLMVRDKGATAPEVQGRFDGIALIPGGDLLFADDFEG